MEDELAKIKKEAGVQKEQIIALTKENLKMKERCKEHFVSIDDLGLLSSHSLSKQNESTTNNTNSIGELHSLYQDLFITDMKKEVETAQTEKKMC